jgi:hypothetical protein
MKRPQTRPISEHSISIHTLQTSRFLNNGGDRRIFLCPVNGHFPYPAQESGAVIAKFSEVRFVKQLRGAPALSRGCAET